MATGDVRGNLERLKVQLRSISYPHALDTQGCKDGLPAAILPLVHYALLGYSRHLARYLSVNGYVLYAKSDLRFVECVMKLLRKEFEYRCPLTVAQIFARGFAEKKFLFVHDLIQMCKRKHNDLLRIVCNFEKKTRVCQPKAFGRMVHLQQKPSFIRSKHLSSKFDRRCELDLLPDTKCHEVCHRSASQENSWVVPAQGKTSLSAISDNEESVQAQSYERVKNHGLRVLTRSHHDNVNENCHLHASMLSKKSSPKTAMMGAQIIHKEHRLGLLFQEPALERNHDYEATSPRSSCLGFNNRKQGITSNGDGTTSCRTTRAPQEDSIELCKDNTKPQLLKGHLSNSTIMHEPDHNFESLEKTIAHRNTEGKGQSLSNEHVTRLEKTPCPSQESCPHVQLHDNQLSTHEDSEWPNVASNTMTDNPPQALWQKFIDLAGKIDMCFCSLDNKIGHSFNSLDNKLETKFKYLDEGVTCTRETLQDKLNTLENRIDNLERTSQISPMSFQTNVTYNEDAHPIRDITNTFNNIVDNGSWRNFTGLQPRDPMVYYPNLLYQQQAMQNIQNIPPMYAGLLKASTQDFIANVRARFYQTKESARLEPHQCKTMDGIPRAFWW